MSDVDVARLQVHVAPSEPPKLRRSHRSRGRAAAGAMPGADRPQDGGAGWASNRRLEIERQPGAQEALDLTSARVNWTTVRAAWQCTIASALARGVLFGVAGFGLAGRFWTVAGLAGRAGAAFAAFGLGIAAVSRATVAVLFSWACAVRCLQRSAFSVRPGRCVTFGCLRRLGSCGLSLCSLIG